MAINSLRQRLLPEYMLEDAYAYEDGLLGAAPTPTYADAGQQAPQVMTAPTYDPNDWRSPEQQQTADIFKRLASGEQIDGWEYFPASTGLYGDSQYEVSEPATIWRNGTAYLENGVQQRNEGIGTVLQDAAKLAAVMGAAYFGGTALAGMGGAGGAGALTGVDAAMADLAASGGLTPASMASAAVPAAIPNAAAAATAAETAAPLVAGNADKAALLGNSGYGPGMTGLQTSAYDGILGATGSKTAADLAATAAGAGSSLKTWAAANPQLAKMAFSGATSLLSTAGGGGGGGGGYQDSGYRPTISRGGWKAQVTPGVPGSSPAPTGLLNNMRPVNLPGQGQANDGLWRYGLLGPGRG